MGSDFAELAPNEQWRDALAAAPRERFVPDVAWTARGGLIDRGADPDAWAAAVARDDAIVTQIDDGGTELDDRSPWTGVAWTSSCSAPGVVFDFLRLLDPYSGDRVLEIGTGSGWTAALLSARLGADHVTSIEVDGQVAAQAKANLDRAGFAPRLLVGDGAAGDPDGAPYDRVHATCGVREIPYSWVGQTRPGGIIALPWIPDPPGDGHKVRLTVSSSSAIGRFHGACGYMVLRSQRRRRPPISGEVRESSSRIDPRRITAGGSGLRCIVAALLPAASGGVGRRNPRDHTFRLSIRDEASDSHAIAIQPPDGGTAEVHQRGPRNLWDELEAAYLTWVRLGEPGAERFGLEVDPDGQHVWLDKPDNRIQEVRQ